MSHAGYETFQELFNSGLPRNGSYPDDFIIPFGVHRGRTYGYVCKNHMQYVRWLIKQDDVKIKYPFMYNYFSNRNV